MADFNRRGVAQDRWLERVPDDPYEPCPCGCGQKFRYVVRDAATLAEHEARFIEQEANTIPRYYHEGDGILREI